MDNSVAAAVINNMISGTLKLGGVIVTAVDTSSSGSGLSTSVISGSGLCGIVSGGIVSIGGGEGTVS
ncbi:hypothetical protein M0R72_01340 [Candidatus Pacearchaeota archaeon]|jgi:hypothetical protein|nr:hypothetical protein [Candidatus Pacearchaeota archaeon]